MKIEETYKKCPTCGKEKIITRAKYKCDYCSKSIPPKRTKEYPCLNVHLGFRPLTKRMKHLHFCSWDCLIKKIKKINTRNLQYIMLPQLMYNLEDPKMSAEAFWKAIKTQERG